MILQFKRRKGCLPFGTSRQSRSNIPNLACHLHHLPFLATRLPMEKDVSVSERADFPPHLQRSASTIGDFGRGVSEMVTHGYTPASSTNQKHLFRRLNNRSGIYCRFGSVNFPSASNYLRSFQQHSEFHVVGRRKIVPLHVGLITAFAYIVPMCAV